MYVICQGRSKRCMFSIQQRKFVISLHDRVKMYFMLSTRQSQLVLVQSGWECSRWSRKEGEEAREEINRWKYRQNKKGQRGRQERRRQREPHCMLDGNQVCQKDTGPDSRWWCLNYLAWPVAHKATCEKKTFMLTWILDQRLLFQLQAPCVCALIKKIIRLKWSTNKFVWVGFSLLFFHLRSILIFSALMFGNH